MRILKRVLLTLFILFVVIQVVRPDMSAPPVDPAKTIQASANIPAPVNAILERSCYDCHSNRTTWPWYAQISPVSWWLKDHVTEARGKLNFSEFATYPKKKAARKLEDLCEEVNKGDMPLKIYLPLHPKARLSSAEKNLVCEWANDQKARIETSMTPQERAIKLAP